MEKSLREHNCMYQRTQPLLHVPLLLYFCIPLIMVGDSVRGSDIGAYVWV